MDGTEADVNDVITLNHVHERVSCYLITMYAGSDYGFFPLPLDPVPYLAMNMQHVCNIYAPTLLACSDSVSPCHRDRLISLTQVFKNTPYIHTHAHIACMYLLPMSDVHAHTHMYVRPLVVV